MTGPTQTTPFIPTAAQWKKATVNLFRYKTEQYVKIRFVNVTDGGNRLYLDDIQINGGLVTATGEPGQYGLPLRLFPNPAFDRVQVRADGGWDEPMHIRVYDNLGRLLRDYGASAAGTLDLAGLPNGLLFVKIESAGRIASFLLMKEK